MYLHSYQGPKTFLLTKSRDIVCLMSKALSTQRDNAKLRAKLLHVPPSPKRIPLASNTATVFLKNLTAPPPTNSRTKLKKLKSKFCCTNSWMLALAMEPSTAFRYTDISFSVRSTSRAGQSAEEGEFRATAFHVSCSSKQVVDAIKDLVQDCNFDCNDSGIALQAMDNSHVALVSMMLKAEGFSPYRCDRNVALGVNLTSLTKVLRAAQNEDILTLKAEDAPDVLNLVFESSESDRLSEYDLKLMDIDQEHLGIPETDYAATISMPSTEFRRICTDLMALSESGESTTYFSLLRLLMHY
jgi:hypothetical protein